MLRQMLYAQWRWSRDTLAFFVVAGFALPLVTLWLMLPQSDLMLAGEAVGFVVLALAVLAGGVIAAQGYGADERVGHVYALSLPITRSRFLVLRTIGGFALLGLPALGVWIGGGVALTRVAIPPMLVPYAGALAVRALLAAWLAHSAVFALRYAAGRRSTIVLGLLIVAGIVVATLSTFYPPSRAVITRFTDMLTSHPGPLGIFFGRWTLIDV